MGNPPLQRSASVFCPKTAWANAPWRQVGHLIKHDQRRGKAPEGHLRKDRETLGGNGTSPGR